MTALRSLTISGVLALALAGSTGCSTVQKGTAAGGALGAGVGMAVSQSVSGLTLAQGAAIGGGTGAATGGIAGDAYELLTKDDVEREIENLRAELRAKDAELAELRTNGGSPETLARLEDAKSQLEKSLSMLDAARGERNAAEAELAGANTELGRLRSDLALAQAKLNDSANQLASLQAGTSREASEAASAKAGLSAAQAELNRAKADLDAQRAATDAAQARAAELARQLGEANGTLANARGELQTVQASLNAKAEDMNALRRELSDLNVELEETSRGLTLTIVNQLLFTAGQAQLSPEGAELLAKVAAIIEEKFPGRELLVEGHTDDQPIVHSGWYSNWELGAARSLAVVHELVTNHNFDPALLSAASYGEHRPTASNATPDGRAINRRSVIVILPEKTAIKRSQFAGL